MTKTTITMEHEKETKNTNRYSEIIEKGKIPLLNTLYLQKWIGNPSKIKVTVEEAV